MTGVGAGTKVPDTGATVGYNGTMSFKTGLLFGLAIGYYLGAKAGRERFEQIDHYLEPVRASDGYQQARAMATDIFGTSVSSTKQAFNDATKPDASVPVDLRKGA